MKRSFKTGFRQNHLDWWLLALRVLVACFMFTHGIPKFYKLMAGGDIQFADPIGLGPVVSLVLAVFAEVVCSTFILVGLATRIATLPLMVVMSVAAFVVNADDPFKSKELPLLYLLIYVTLLILGSGRYSIDFLLGRRLA